MKKKEPEKTNKENKEPPKKTNKENKEQPEKESKTTLQKRMGSTPFLWTVFVILLIIVIVLGCIIHQKEYEKNQAFNSNMMIPLFEIETSFTFGIDAKALSKLDSREYVIKLTNYKDDEIYEEEMTYQLFVENLTDSVISLRKESFKENLIAEQKYTLLDQVMPASKEKKEIYFHIHLDSFKNLQKGDFIHVKIIREAL